MVAKRKPTKTARAISASPDRIQLNSISTPSIFVSHDSRDAELAEAFSKLLSGVSTGMLKSFRSSDKRGNQGIQFGVEWYPEVMSQIDSATDVVCLLTAQSLERPWILYEAGVAKGKMNTPVYGLALGIPLAKASAGPFAQFQNCEGDADSLNKLVLQLMGRIPGAEPDKDTVRMQVQVFIDKVASHIKKPQDRSTAEMADSSVAKLFEEVKVMFRDLPSRIDSRSERITKPRSLRFHPEMIYDIGHRFDGPKGDHLGLLILVSMFKEDVPWLFELGMDVYRNLTSKIHYGSRQALDSLNRLEEACDLLAHHPLFRDILRNEEVIRAAIELRSFASHLADVTRRRYPAKKVEASDPKS